MGQRAARRQAYLGAAHAALRHSAPHRPSCAPGATRSDRQFASVRRAARCFDVFGIVAHAQQQSGLVCALPASLGSLVGSVRLDDVPDRVLEAREFAVEADPALLLAADGADDHARAAQARAVLGWSRLRTA